MSELEIRNLHVGVEGRDVRPVDSVNDIHAALEVGIVAGAADVRVNQHSSAGDRVIGIAALIACGGSADRHRWVGRGTVAGPDAAVAIHAEGG